MIARRLPLLVARLVLFVHDYRAEILQRREDRRARTDCDFLFTALECEPGIVALAIAESGVQNRDAVAEDGAKSVDGLGGERDLGNENDRGFVFLEDDALEQLDVDERFAASGYAV